jgi:hypothetical protein
MAIVVLWSDQAKKTFANNVDYLQGSWTEKEVTKFILRSEYVLLNIEENPLLYSESNKGKNIRKATINKQITLFYRYYLTKKMVVLLSFWNNYQDTKKLKFK